MRVKDSHSADGAWCKHTGLSPNGMNSLSLLVEKVLPQNGITERLHTVGVPSHFYKLAARKIIDDSSSTLLQFGTLACRHGPTTYALSHACMLTDSH